MSHAQFHVVCLKLHPQSDWLWQQAKNKEDIHDLDVWYKPLKIGPNLLASFMSHVSHDADLSRVYTNHSIRSTATTFLGRANFSPKQIMSVTGHRSLNSLSVYQKVSQNEKLAMGCAMNSFLQSGEQVRAVHNEPKPLKPIAPKQTPYALGAPHSEKIPQKSAPSKEIVAYQPEDPLLQANFNEEIDFDVQEVLTNVEKESFLLMQVEPNSGTSMTVQCQTVSRRSPNIPIFSNCKIGQIQNLHIHLHKN